MSLAHRSVPASTLRASITARSWIVVLAPFSPFKTALNVCHASPDGSTKIQDSPLVWCAILDSTVPVGPWTASNVRLAASILDPNCCVWIAHPAQRAMQSAWWNALRARWASLRIAIDLRSAPPVHQARLRISLALQVANRVQKGSSPTSKRIQTEPTRAPIVGRCSSVAMTDPQCVTIARPDVYP